MAVSDCAVGGSSMTIEAAQGCLSQPKGHVHPVSQLRALAALCNAAEFDASDSNAPLAKRHMFGDATDKACLHFAEFVETGSVAYFRGCWKKVYDLAFNSKNKFMLRCFTIIHQDAASYTLDATGSTSFDKSDTYVSLL